MSQKKGKIQRRPTPEELELDIAQRVEFEQNKKEHVEKKMCPMDEPVKELTPDEQKKDNKKLLIGIAVVVAIFVAFMLFVKLSPEETPYTIDELHQGNIAGTLENNDGYVYNGFSFIHLGDLWYSQVQKGNTIYDITFNNDPKSVEDIPVQGELSTRFEQEGNRIYITFDPNTYSAKFITVANAGLSMGLVKGFGYNLTATCTDNETAACRTNGVVTCEDQDKAVIYFKEADDTLIMLEDNCVTIQGNGPELVRAKDRLLMRWYGIMN